MTSDIIDVEHWPHTGAKKRQVREERHVQGMDDVMMIETTCYDPGSEGKDGPKRLMVTESYKGPRDNPRARMHLVERVIDEFDPTGHFVMRKTTEYYDGSDKVIGTSKRVKEWSDQLDDNGKHILRFSYIYQWDDKHRAWKWKQTLEWDDAGHKIHEWPEPES